MEFVPIFALSLKGNITGDIILEFDDRLSGFGFAYLNWREGAIFLNVIGIRTAD